MVEFGVFVRAGCSMVFAEGIEAQRPKSPVLLFKIKCEMLDIAAGDFTAPRRIVSLEIPESIEEVGIFYGRDKLAEEF